MNHAAIDWALMQRGLKPVAKLLLCILAKHCNPQTLQCERALHRLAEDCEVSISTVQRHVRHLEATGLIRRKRHNRGLEGSWDATAYLLKADLPGGNGTVDEVEP